MTCSQMRAHFAKSFGGSVESGEGLRVGRPVLDRHAEAEERLHAVLYERVDERVREDEAIVRRIGLVGVEVGEEVRNVDIEPAAEVAADVMEARKGNPRLLEVVHHRPVFQRAHHGRLPYAVHGFHGADGLVGMDGDRRGVLHVVFDHSGFHGCSSVLSNGPTGRLESPYRQPK